MQSSRCVRCRKSALWDRPFCLAAFLTWLWAGLTAAAECYRTSDAQVAAAARACFVTSPGREQASHPEPPSTGQSPADRSSPAPACVQSAGSGLLACLESSHWQERNFSPALYAWPHAADPNLPAEKASPVGCDTQLVAWGPYYPWRYRPRWVYPYRYYPLRRSYSVYSPYYFYSPYVRWPAAPTWGYRGYLAFGWVRPWYVPWAWGGFITPYYGGWTGAGLDACCDCLCNDGPCYGCGPPLPYDTGPYFGWPYDAGRSFAIPWAGLPGACCTPQFAPSCPPGCIDASGALHW